MLEIIKEYIRSWDEIVPPTSDDLHFDYNRK